MSATNTNEDKIEKKYKDRLTAIAKYTTPNDPILINGSTVAASGLAATYQKGLDTRQVLADKRGETKLALQSRQAADAACREIAALTREAFIAART